MSLLSHTAPQLNLSMTYESSVEFQMEIKIFAVAISARRRRKVWRFHVVILHRTAKKCTKFQNALAELLFCQLDLLFFYVFVAVTFEVS